VPEGIETSTYIHRNVDANSQFTYADTIAFLSPIAIRLHVLSKRGPLSSQLLVYMRSSSVKMLSCPVCNEHLPITENEMNQHVNSHFEKRDHDMPILGRALSGSNEGNPSSSSAWISQDKDMSSSMWFRSAHLLCSARAVSVDKQ
jgi:hypothetical protein